MKNGFNSRSFKIFLAIGLGVSCFLSCSSNQTNQDDSRNPGLQYLYGSPQNQERAELYIYRPFRFGSGGAEPYIYINGRFKGTIPNKSYRGFSFSPGEYYIETRLGKNWISGNPSEFVLTMTKGNRYFLRIGAETTFDIGNFLLAFVGMGGSEFMGSDFPLFIVEEEKALNDLLDMGAGTLRFTVH